jgi:anti-sigma regulatory factor (Ser/Thr protein kinase)
MPADVGGSHDTAFRSEILRRFGAPAGTVPALLAFTESPYRDLVAPPSGLPLEDERHVATWLEYERHGRERGAVTVLRERLVQLGCPVRTGISSEPAYAAATKRGDRSALDAYRPGLTFSDPAGIDLTVHEASGGRVPVVTAHRRDDFERLVQAFTERNEPAPVPASMGACLVAGLNNWDRVAAYRERWEADHPGARGEEWAAAFRQMAARKELYQDRFILLSRGPYSGVPAADVGLAEEEWLDRSLVLRREHEFAHYFTWRLSGRLRTHPFDEVLADFAGLVGAFGEYRSDVARLALGLERGPGAYREGGRLQNYCASLPADAFTIVLRMTDAAVANLERLGRIEPGTTAELARVLWGLAGLSFEALASDACAAELTRRLAQFLPRMRRVDLPDGPGAVGAALQALDAVTADWPHVRAVQRDLHLVIDEIVSNILKYARPPADPFRASVAIGVEDHQVTLVFEDNGPPFNPLAAAAPALTTSLEERPIGGVGLFIALELMDAPRYERLERGNRLSFSRRLPPDRDSRTPA